MRIGVVRKSEGGMEGSEERKTEGKRLRIRRCVGDRKVKEGWKRKVKD